MSATRSIEPRTYTPNHLVERILRTRGALEGERKQITVMFVDLEGSVALSESLDPEELHDLLDGFFRLLSDPVHRYEGSVNQYTGDGIMALFGAPIAHEDHARRACYAALEMRDAVAVYGRRLQQERGLSLPARIGLNSGDVVVGRIGDDLRMDYTAQGSVVGIASRVTALAGPGRIAIADATARLVRGFFSVNAMGSERLKGVAEPLPIHQLTAISAHRTSLDVARSRGLSTFVGRGDQLAALDAALERALRTDGNTVCVVGEAGVGKSRLGLQFVQRCADRGVAIRRAHCVSHGRATPFLPVRELLSDLLEVARDDGAGAACARIERRLHAVLPGFEGASGLVCDFLGLAVPEGKGPGAPDTRQRTLQQLLRALIRALAEAQPMILVLDDLHWIDRASEGLLEQVVAAAAGARVLVLANFRPEYAPAWLGLPHVETVLLPPLERDRIEHMLSAMVLDSNVAHELAGRICDQVGGNPFFVEEFVESLVEQGVLRGERGQLRLTGTLDAIEIPSTVESVVAARIDRLPERTKEILQVASVIGGNFRGTLLRELVEHGRDAVGSALRTLCAGELLRDGVAEDDYAFKHPVTKRVAYESQLRARRTVVHARVARALAAAPAARERDAALIAHHFELADQRLEAVRWNIEAAEVAGSWDAAQTMRQLQRARELAGRAPAEPGLLELAIGAGIRALAFGTFASIDRREADRIFAQTQALIASDQVNVLAALHAWYSNWLDNADEADAEIHARRAHELAEASPHPRALLDVAWAVLRYLSDAGQLREAVAFAERALARVDSARMTSPIARTQIANTKLQLSQMLGLLGRPLASIAAAEQAETLADELREPQGPVVAARTKCLAARLLGRADDELRFAGDAVERANRWDNPRQRLICQLVLARALLSHDRIAEAHAHLEQVEAQTPLGPDDNGGMAGRRVLGALVRMQPIVRAELELARHNAPEALRLAELTIEHMNARTRIYPPYRADAWHVLATSLIRTNPTAHAERIAHAIGELDTLVRNCQLGSYEPLLHELRAEHAAAIGDARTRHGELARARLAFLEMGAELQVARIDRALVEL